MDGGLRWMDRWMDEWNTWMVRMDGRMLGWWEWIGELLVGGDLWMDGYT